MATIYDDLPLFVGNSGPLTGGNYGSMGPSAAASFPGGGLFDIPGAGGGGRGGFNDPISGKLKKIPGPLGDLFGDVGGMLGGLFGGKKKPRTPYWQRLAKREIAQGNAALAAYNALYEPTLALAQRSATDYGDLYRRAANEALAHNILSSRETRKADLQDYLDLGPQLLTARREADPLFSQAYDLAGQDLSEVNAALPQNVRRDISQSVLQSLNERGMSLGGAGAFEEALALTMGGEEFRNNRRDRAFREATSLLSLYGDPFQSLTGRVASPAPQGKDVMSPDYEGFNENLFSYGVNREIQSRDLDAARGASRNALIGSIIQGVLGAAGGAAMACWVAREVFGEKDARWLQFRDWLIRKSPLRFFQWYLRNGEAYAKEIAKPEWAETKARLKTWMEDRIAEAA